MRKSYKYIVLSLARIEYFYTLSLSLSVGLVVLVGLLIAIILTIGPVIAQDRLVQVSRGIVTKGHCDRSPQVRARAGVRSSVVYKSVTNSQ
jgi:hypothetical protein